MKNLYLGIAVVVLLVAGVMIYMEVEQTRLANEENTGVAPILVAREDLSFDFSYQSGVDGFTLIEPPVATSTMSTSTGTGLQDVFLLMDAVEYAEYQQTEGAQTPPTISMFVFTMFDESDEPRITRLQNWAQANSALTSFDQISTETEVIELDGVQALRYNTAGQYEQTVYLASYKGNAYVFIGQYESAGDEYDQAFAEVIESISFY